jgi:hypothetical protein
MRMNQDRGRGREWFGQDPTLVQEWLRQNNLIYGGLIAIGVYMVQPFLTAGSLDLSARICVVAFSVAIPLLAGLLVLNRQEIFRGRATSYAVVEVTKVVAQTCAFAGVVAGFWHILWIAGVGILAGGLVAVGCTRPATCVWNRAICRHPPTPRNPTTPRPSFGPPAPASATGTSGPRRRARTRSPAA